MKILVVCHRFPFPPKRGGKIRPFNIIRHLHQSHEVSVASLVRSDAEADEARGIAAHCTRYEMARVHAPMQVARMVARLPSPVPSSIGFFHSPALARAIVRLAERHPFDLVFVHCSSVAHYAFSVNAARKILDFGDMDSQKWLEYARFKRFPFALGYALEGAKLAARERRLARHFDMCTTTTRAEWDTLEGFATGATTDWFPNGVDSDYFAPSTRPYDPETIGFIGRMDYYPNQECMLRFCRDTFPRIRARRPGVKLIIVGADPSPAIRSLGDLPGVTVTGSVSDVRPYLHDVAAMVAPLSIARGTQNKILEAMSAGVPVVTSRTAAEGVDAVPGAHFLVADKPEDVAEAVLGLVEQPQMRARFAEAGRARMLSHHTWQRSMQRLDRIIERCTAARGETALKAHALAPGRTLS